MTKRELFKHLKDKNVFSRFCIVCAEAWTDIEYMNPRDRLNHYLNVKSKVFETEKDVDDFIYSVKRWKVGNEVKII